MGEMSFIAASITLFFVMDPLGNIPIFVSVLQKVPPHKRRKTVIRELLIAFVILQLFLFFGKYILRGLHITESALIVSGGLILFLIALRMIFPTHRENSDVNENEEPFIVPLAVPLITGPSLIATVMLFVSQAPERLLEWFLAGTAAWSASFLLLIFAEPLVKKLGNRVIKAIERLMGLILTTIAIQMLLSGIREYFF
ncbi:MAG: MarC family protein [Spirochaetia bacterium]